MDILQLSDSSFRVGSNTIVIRKLGNARSFYTRPALGVGASANVTNYPAGKIDSVFYKFSTTPYGTGSSQDYGGWLTSNLTGDSVRVSTPFWVCIGNSITEGHPSTHGRLHPVIDLTKDDVPGQITYYLRQLTNMRFFNQGIGGQTSTQIWARWNRDVLAQTVSGIKTLTEKPQGVIVECGINDFYSGISVATLKQNLIKMAASAAREGIYCVMLTVPGDEINNYTQNKQVDEINDWLRSGALNKYHVILVDFNRWWQDAAYNDNLHGNSLLIDDIHPTPAGYDSLAHYIYNQAMLPRLEAAIVYTQLSPDGFNGYSRPANITFNNTPYTITSALDTLELTAPISIDTAWIKILTSTNVTGTLYTGISHINYLLSYPVQNNLISVGKLSSAQTLYPYLTVKDGKIGVQTENPSTPFEVNNGMSRSESVPIGPELRTYYNLAGGQGPNSHFGKGGFYLLVPDGIDATFANYELDFTDAALGTAKMTIGLVNHFATVTFDGFMAYNQPAVRIGSNGAPGYIIIGDSSYNWDFAVMKISRLNLYAGFSLANYASYDTVTVRFTTQPINLFTSINPTVNFSIAYYNPVRGTTTNNNATAGNIGEYVFSNITSGSAVPLSNGTPANITSITLTAGDWDIEGSVSFSLAAATATSFKAGGSGLSANFGADNTWASTPINTTTLTDIFTQNIPRQRISIATSSTVFLVGQTNFSAGSISGYGLLRARRVR
jgi:lysophospholipase L1-like esterase